MNNIAENIAAVRKTITLACAGQGRDPTGGSQQDAAS
jgi:hypothetical protein